MASLVKDDCEPMPFTSFTDDDMRLFPLQELYKRTCAQLRCKPNPVILEQLPATLGQHYRLMMLDCRRTYLGSKGVVALCPVIERCIRLTHLNFNGVGMKAAAAKTLLLLLATHPGIMCLNISNNELGTAVGQLLHKLVSQHHRVHDVQYENILLIDPLRKKIDAQLQKNEEKKSTFSIPLIPEDSDDVDMVKKRERAAEEVARKIREEQFKKELAEKIPTWAPAALMELSECFFKHREHMEDVFSVFDRGVREPTIDPQYFLRAMRIFGIHTLDEQNRCRELCDLFGAWNRETDEVNYAIVVETLRDHATFSVEQKSAPPTTEKDASHEEQSGSEDAQSAAPSTTESVRERNRQKLRRAVVDRLFDSKKALQLAFEALDLDQQGEVVIEEAVVGLLSVVNKEPAEATINSIKAIIVQLVEEFFGHSSSSEVTVKNEENAGTTAVRPRKLNYGQFLSGFKVRPDARPRTQWSLKRTELLTLAAECRII